jgi:hypothetical protein
MEGKNVSEFLAMMLPVANQLFRRSKISCSNDIIILILILLLLLLLLLLLQWLDSPLGA